MLNRCPAIVPVITVIAALLTLFLPTAGTTGHAQDGTPRSNGTPQRDSASRPAGAAGQETSVRIAGFERFHRAAPGASREAGLLLLRELNCVACHDAGGAVPTSLDSKQSPVLTEVGGRVHPEWYLAFLSDPQRVKPGTTMPAMFDGSENSKRRVESLAHFLASTGELAERAASPAAVNRGRKLFRELGCAACHDLPEADAPRLETSVPLGNLLAKYTVVSLTRFLSDPLHVRPSGRMPALNLSGQEAADVAAYLLRDLELPAGLTFKAFRGSWQNLPNFEELKPESTGTAHQFDVGVTPHRDQFGLRFEGRLQLDQPGDYTFHVGSDDGSRLWIDGSVVVDNDGVHAFQMKSGKVKLEAGTHSIRVDYFEQGGEERLSVELEGPGLPRQDAAARLVVPDDGRQPFQVNAELVRAGREVFLQAGCANCHTLGEQDRDLQSTARSAPALKTLDPAAGCLSEAPAPGVPRYALDATQRDALREALRGVQGDATFAGPKPAETIHRTLVAFNCYACHERQGVGGVETERNAFFTSDQPEMGDEGRIPPQLTGVGDKLRVSWLRHVFNQGAKDRPYMATRMPRFGEANLGHLPDLLAREDKPSEPAFETDIPDRRLKVAGREMAGVKGYSCIKCHTFGEFQSTGIQAISLTTMHQRLNPGWFHRYLLNPQTYRPGTRMPAAWPNGQVLLPQILSNDAPTQIHAVWTYLSDGEKAATPLGLRTAPLELVPIDRALLYRNFIEGAGTRAIGVGYPQRVNLAFDANNLRLALLWQGPFIDASKHWTGRGQGFQPPLGVNVLRLPDLPPLARLADEETAWPAGPVREQDDYRFLGYGLDSQGRPTFRYRFQEITVADAPLPIDDPDSPGIRRRLTFQSERPMDGTWWHVMTAPRIEDLGDGWFQINGDWKIRLELPAPLTPTLRRQGDQQQLLVPLPPRDQPISVVQEYNW